MSAAKKSLAAALAVEGSAEPNPVKNPQNPLAGIA
jgi:hypothetical protein